MFSIAQVFVLTTHNHKVNIKQRIIEDHILKTKTYQTTHGGIINSQCKESTWELRKYY